MVQVKANTSTFPRMNNALINQSVLELYYTVVTFKTQYTND